MLEFFQLVERRLNFHSEHLGGGGNYTALYATTEPQTDSDQESYVQQDKKWESSKQDTHKMRKIKKANNNWNNWLEILLRKRMRDKSWPLVSIQAPPLQVCKCAL